jgi:hypothetical protein
MEVATRRAARVIAIAIDLMIEVCVFMIAFTPVCFVYPPATIPPRGHAGISIGEVVLDSAISRVTSAINWLPFAGLTKYP